MGGPDIPNYKSPYKREAGRSILVDVTKGVGNGMMPGRDHQPRAEVVSRSWTRQENTCTPSFIADCLQKPRHGNNLNFH